MSADFLDTNVFVYLFEETDDRKYRIARSLVREGIANRSGAISYQVVQETLNVITRKVATPATPSAARRYLERVLVPLWRVMPRTALYARGLELQARYGYSFYDSLIVAAALDAGCSRLFSEDLQHGQQIDGLTIENPFRD